MDARVIATGLCFPEGPVALADGSIALVEIERQTVSRVRPNGAVEVIARTGGGPNGMALGPDGALYVANNGGFAWRIEHGMLRPVLEPSDYTSGRIERVDIATGETRVLYDRCDGHKLRGPNDIVFDGKGGFYFSDLGKTRRATAIRAASITRPPTAAASSRSPTRSSPRTASACRRTAPPSTSPRPRPLGCGPSTSRRPASRASRSFRRRMAAGW